MPKKTIEKVIDRAGYVHTRLRIWEKLFGCALAFP